MESRLWATDAGRKAGYHFPFDKSERRAIDLDSERLDAHTKSSWIGIPGFTFAWYECGRDQLYALEPGWNVPEIDY